MQVFASGSDRVVLDSKEIIALISKMTFVPFVPLAPGNPVLPETP